MYRINSSVKYVQPALFKYSRHTINWTSLQKILEKSLFQGSRLMSINQNKIQDIGHGSGCHWDRCYESVEGLVYS